MMEPPFPIRVYDQRRYDGQVHFVTRSTERSWLFAAAQRFTHTARRDVDDAKIKKSMPEHHRDALWFTSPTRSIFNLPDD